MTQKNIAELLLDIKAVFLRPNDPFTWVSGIKSPIYCDNRLILSYPEARKKVERALADNVLKHYPQTELIAGTSTAGIAHAAFIAQLLNLPMVYVRSAAKEHGRKNLIEGMALPNQKTVVVEDLISTAGSVVGVVQALREAGTEVLGIVSIFSYEMRKGIERLEDSGVKNVSLSNYTALTEAALEAGMISENDLKKLRAFQSDPEDAAWMTL